MASVDYQKLKGPQEVKAMLRHCDTDEREQATHSNKDINKDLTKYNAQGQGTYQEICDKYDRRIGWLDMCQGANLRKDRVTCFGLAIPVPDGMTDPRQQARWMGRVVRCIGDQYGDENILQYFAHWDEVHEYTDAETGVKRESRPHLHAYVIPEHDGKLNGKWFSSAANMRKLNQAIQDMTQKEFGLDFMDGSKKKSRKEVETLKNESLSREIESKQSQLATLNEKIVAAQELRLQLRDKMQDELDTARREYKRLQEAQRTAKSAVWSMQRAQGHRGGGASLVASMGAVVASAVVKAAHNAAPERVASIRSPKMLEMEAMASRGKRQSGPPDVEGPER